ncbi:MAG TPA: AIR synthase-related protein, partial [Vicinamibacterales bacterium]|nr:AIR synthase-related protein [Vicinamibacterales bacterium]
GNVSLYNETDGKAIYPTPILGVVGLIEDASKVLARSFRDSGDEIVLLGESFGELGGSQYLATIAGAVMGEPPQLDLDRERALIALLTRAAAEGLIRSAHDCSDGGVAVALAECAFDTGGIGFEVDLPGIEVASAPAVSAVATLFGESASRAIVSIAPAKRSQLMQLATSLGVPALAIGRTGGSRIRIAIAGEPAIDLSVAQAEQAWSTALERYLAGRAA